MKYYCATMSNRAERERGGGERAERQNKGRERERRERGGEVEVERGREREREGEKLQIHRLQIYSKTLIITITTVDISHCDYSCPSSIVSISDLTDCPR